MIPNRILDGLDQAKRQAVTATEGPVLILAGPGTGKTLTLVRRTLHIIAQELALPRQILLCSFTEKSALELRDRITRDSAELDVNADLSELSTGTIHSICNEIIANNRQRTSYGAHFEVIDDLGQRFFFYRHFEDVVNQDSDTEESPTYVGGKFQTKWSCIEGLLPYFDKIADELIDIDLMLQSHDFQTSEIAACYLRYRTLLKVNNKLDFAHLQLEAFELLQLFPETRRPYLYVMVDEFQDTNAVQNAIFNLLTEHTSNLCVVGDEDQSLYRFRGATVENILLFPTRHPETEVFNLDVNYRSEAKILNAYSDYMLGHDWSNDDGPDFRFKKTLTPAHSGRGTSPSLLQIHGKNPVEESDRVAEMILRLKTEGFIEDFSQVAILLHSVRDQHSRDFVESLAEVGIETYCPRAKMFFENREVKLAFASLGFVLGWNPREEENSSGRSASLEAYMSRATKELSPLLKEDVQMSVGLENLRAEILSLSEGETLNKRLADYLYEFLAFESFRKIMSDETGSRNLAAVSRYLSLFHQYYGYQVITAAGFTGLRLNFFNSFLSFLVDGGVDDYEDPNVIAPLGRVQIMTIHQSKGLEFPVTIVGSLGHRARNNGKERVERLMPFMQRKPMEPQDKVAEFDSMRLFYVALSRAQKLLVLSHNSIQGVHARFESIIQKSIEYTPSLFQNSNEPWSIKKAAAPSQAFSFTSDIKSYETCAKQYSIFRALDFAPSRSVTILFGTLVHQTIEDIHRQVLAGNFDLIDRNFIVERFEFNQRILALREIRAMGEGQQKAALNQIINYWDNNKTYVKNIEDAEIEISVEQDGFVLRGVLDLVVGEQGNLEVLDFKTGKKPDANDPLTLSYYQQLCIYANILEKRKGIRPAHLVIYWTGEDTREKARMVFDYDRSDVDSALEHFSSIVGKIKSREFEVETPPARHICDECDLKKMCVASGVIS